MKYKFLSTSYLGAGLLVIALLMWKFLPPTNLFNFFEGMLVGLSIPLNLRLIFSQSRMV